MRPGTSARVKGLFNQLLATMSDFTPAPLLPVSTLKTIRTNFDIDEKRRDRRYPLPVVVSLGGIDYTTVNWSLGGFLIADAPNLRVGGMFRGRLRLAHLTRTYDFTAQVLRRDREAGTLAFCFVECSPPMLAALDRALAERMAGQRAR